MDASRNAMFHQPIPPSGLPPAADELLQRMLAMAADFVGSPAGSFSNLHDRYDGGHGQSYCSSGKALRTPRLSVLGFASLLLGISSTLMLFGSLAFFVGFMLMPLILPASIVVCVSALLPAFKDAWQPPSSSSISMWGSKFLQKEAWF